MILARATGALEADLSKRFAVPLAPASGAGYPSVAPAFAVNLVTSAMIAKVKELLGSDNNKVAMGPIDSTEKFINVFSQEYKDILKTLLDPGVELGFAYARYAVDAKTPIQHIGLSKADNCIDSYNYTGSFRRGDDEGF